MATYLIGVVLDKFLKAVDNVEVTVLVVVADVTWTVD